MSDDFFAPPPFNLDEAMRRATRELRAMGLVERAGVFEWAGDPIIRLKVEGVTIRAEIVREPLRSPQWRSSVLRHSGDLRDFLADATKKVRDWKDEPEE
jgi:hypothetical protein